jgi:hypothetical protein
MHDLGNKEKENFCRQFTSLTAACVGRTKRHPSFRVGPRICATGGRISLMRGGRVGRQREGGHVAFPSRFVRRTTQAEIVAKTRHLIVTSSNAQSTHVYSVFAVSGHRSLQSKAREKSREQSAENTSATPVPVVTGALLTILATPP